MGPPRLARPIPRVMWWEPEEETPQAFVTSVDPYESGDHFKGFMSIKHLALDRKLFNWIRENRTGLSVSGAQTQLKIRDKAERRHICRRFSQLQARGLLRLIQEHPWPEYEVRGEIPRTTSDAAWKKFTQARLTSTPVIITDAPSIEATNSEEFLARGGKLHILPPLQDLPRRSVPTGSGFTFDE